MTKIEKEVNQRRLKYTKDTIGKTIKSFGQWGYTHCIIFTDDTFITTTACEGYDDVIEFNYDSCLNLPELKYMGLIDDNTYQEGLKRQEQARKAVQDYRDKTEYKRLKEKFEKKSIMDICEEMKLDFKDVGIEVD